MGRKVKDHRIKSNKLIKEAPLCNNCPARIYNNDNNAIMFGKGNLAPNVIFVLPENAISSKLYQEYLNIVLKGIIDINYEYITYHPKCKVNSPVEGYANYCRHYLLHEIRQCKPKIIVFFGVDIPEELYNILSIKLFKFKDILSIHYNNSLLEDFRNKLKLALL